MNGLKQSGPERTRKQPAAAVATHWPTPHGGPSTGRRAAANSPELTRTQRTCGPGQTHRYYDSCRRPGSEDQEVLESTLG
jgi:hypothetical protein